MNSVRPLNAPAAFDLVVTANRDPGDEHRVTTDPETVEEWATEYDVVPVGVPGEEPKVRFLPREQAEAEMAGQERMEWQEFHHRFERGELALIDRGGSEEGWRYDLVDRSEVGELGEPAQGEIDEPAQGDRSADAGERSSGDRTLPKPRDQGKDVVDASGERIGMVADVRGNTLYVDPHPSLTGRIRAALDWGDVDEAAFPIQSEKIRRIYNDVVLDVERPDERP